MWADASENGAAALIVMAIYAAILSRQNTRPIKAHLQYCPIKCSKWEC
jgi:hypothetical protein